MKKYFSFLFILILSISSAFAQISGPGGGGGGGSLTSGVSPVSGCSPGQFLYNNSGLLGCQAGSGGISGPGTTVSNNLVIWNSSTGASIADSGIPYGNLALTTASNIFNQGQRVTSSNQYSGFTGNNGTNATFSLQGTSVTNDNGTLSLNNGGVNGIFLRASGGSYINNGSGLSIGMAANPVYPLDVVGNIHTTTGLLINGTTVIDTIQSGNSSAQARTLSIPNTGNVTDAFALLGATNAFTGPNSFAGAGVASPAINTTSLMGGTTAPTTGTNAGTLWIGGNYAAPSLSTAGQALISVTATGGLSLQGNPYVTFYSANGTQQAGLVGGLFEARAFGNLLTNREFYNATAPTWNAGFGGTTTVGTQNGTSAFQVTIPASPSGSTGTVNLPSATTEWNCYANDKTNATTVVVAQTGWAATTATFTAFSRTTGAAVTWTTGDVIEMSCSGL